MDRPGPNEPRRERSESSLPQSGPTSAGGELVRWAWDLASALLVVVGASIVYRGFAPASPLTTYVAELWAIATSSLALFAFASRFSGQRARIFVLGVVSVGLAAYGGAYLLLRTFGDAPVSRVILGFALILAVAMASSRAVRARRGGIVAGIVAAAVLVLAGVGVGRVRSRSDVAARAVQTVPTALALLDLQIQPGLAGPLLGNGGAITRMGADFLLMTARGALYRLSWDESASALQSRRIELPPPMDRQAYLADLPDTLRARMLRVTSIVLDTTASPTRLYVAHLAWNRASRCFTLQVSSASLPGPVDPVPSTAPWRREFNSDPCLPDQVGFQEIEGGGRLAWAADGGLLLTTGHFGYDGTRLPRVSQDTSNTYGKVFRRDPMTQGWSVFTTGHRNPQGLFVDRHGRIWETEHGPKGGDEVNILVAGQDYGWPSVTYGTQYGARSWPLDPTGLDHRGYAEPFTVFLPSIGISNLLVIEGSAFPQWSGDLIVSSLGAQSLWRVRHRENRVIYVEKIPIGRRIRDLVEGADGRLVMWTDQGDVLTIAPTRRGSTPAIAFEQCKACHTDALGFAIGPDLRGVIGRRIGAQADFAYSPALRAAGGTWTEARLDAFLRSPNTFAPGTSMTWSGIDDPAERRKVIEYLREYRE